MTKANNPQKSNNILPGFGLSLGYTLLYLSLIVLIPLSAAFIKTSTLSLVHHSPPHW
jgi:sulfate transport system permease protein